MRLKGVQKRNEIAFTIAANGKSSIGMLITTLDVFCFYYFTVFNKRKIIPH